MTRLRARRMRAVRPQILDAAIALVLGLAGALSGFSPHYRHAPAAVLVALSAMGLALFPRRRLPGVVLVAEAVLAGVLVALHASLEGAFLPVLVAAYSAAIFGGRRLTRALAVVVPVLLGVGIWEARLADSWLRAYFPVPTVLAASAAWLVGLVIRRQFALRDAALAATAERADLIASRQAESQQRVLLTERLRIARELHDIVAHHLSVIVIQSQGAQRMADRDPERARKAMADAEQTGRKALEEMRHLLGLLRTGEAAPAPGDDPPVGLADVDDLAGQIRRVGLPVTVIRKGSIRDVPEDVGLTVYRVVQEALTNVLKHAGPASAVVSLSFADDLDVLITDDGRGAAATAAAVPGAGRGTAGMTERVTALGGLLSAGPQPGGGYRVHARIPLGAS